METRNVDWHSFPEVDPSLATLRDGVASSELLSLLASFNELIACRPADAMLRRAVEIARERIGLARVAIFLRDELRGVMCGTWGTDLSGATVDEHGVRYELWDGEHELYERSESGVFWTVVDQAPLIENLPTRTRVVGQGWVCCTPIRIDQEPVGMMFNDAGLSHARIDEEKQTRVAMLCSILGNALDVARRRGDSVLQIHASGLPPAVAKATKLLADDPALTADELGERVGLSSSRMARVFKQATGLSLVDYRNRLRLERFTMHVDGTGSNLLEAALLAGFGSYAQFHRVFVAQRGMTPGKYFREHARQK